MPVLCVRIPTFLTVSHRTLRGSYRFYTDSLTCYANSSINTGTISKLSVTKAPWRLKRLCRPFAPAKSVLYHHSVVRLFVRHSHHAYTIILRTITYTYRSGDMADVLVVTNKWFSERYVNFKSRISSSGKGRRLEKHRYPRILEAVVTIKYLTWWDARQSRKTWQGS